MGLLYLNKNKNKRDQRTAYTLSVGTSILLGKKERRERKKIYKLSCASARKALPVK